MNTPNPDFDDLAARPTVIKPREEWKLADWPELILYRDLLFTLVVRDIKVIYKQTILGFGWAILRPLLSMVVFTVVFGRLAKVPTDGMPYPIFYFAALVPWTYFSSSLTASADSLVLQREMLTKIYFPRLLLPLTPVIARLVDFGIAFVVLILMAAGYGVRPSASLMLIPLLLVLMIVTVTGISTWLSALAVQYRDVRFVTPFFVQILLFAAPVVWPASLVPEEYRYYYGLYPMAGVIEGFRAAITGTLPVPWDLLAVGCLSSLAILFSGLLFFHRSERFFADVA